MVKYTPELVNTIKTRYLESPSTETVKELSKELDIPERSIIAKLSSLGVYQKKQYVNKRGEIPVKKEEYIERIAKLLDMNVELMESLEKVTKTVLVQMEERIKLLKE